MTDEPKTPAKAGKDTVYVDVEDDITAIIDKVEAAGNKVVALVLPKRSTTLQSIVNMRLLKRSAENAEKNVVLITSEAALLPLAGAAKLHVAKNLQSAPEIPPPPLDAKVPVKAAEAEAESAEPDEKAKLDYDKPMGELAADEGETIALKDHAAEAETKKPAKVAKPPKNSKLKIPNFDLFRNRLGLAIAAFVLLILIFIVGGKVLPKATITLQTTSEPISASLNLTTSDKAKKLDLKSNTIPAELKTTDQSANQQVTATGQKNLGTKANGNISMQAERCAPNLANKPSTVPAGSAVTQNGLTYITQSDTSFNDSASPSSPSCVTYNSTSSTTIKAQEGGSNYNTGSTSFSVSGRSDVTATGSASGGTDNKVTILSQSDVDAAVKKVTGDNNKDLTDKFKKGLDDEGLYVLESSLKQGKAQISASPAVGQQASTSSVSIKITYSVLTVKKDDLKAAIQAALEKEIDKAHQKVSTDDVLKDADVSIQSQSSPTVASLSITERSTAVPQLDENAVKQQIGGKKVNDIKDLLGNLPGIKNVDVNFSPFWVSKAPKNQSKIHIILQEISTTNQSSGQNQQP